MTSSALGAQDALAAGGRYDQLVKALGGPDVPALGFAMGVERALQAIAASQKEASQSFGPLSIFVAALGDTAAAKAFQLMQELRGSADLGKAGAVIEGGFFEKKLSAQLGIADRLGASHCLILGDEEIQKEEVTLRTMKTSSQERLPRRGVVSKLLALSAFA